MEAVRQLYSEAWQSIWFGYGYLTAKEIYPTNLLIHWQLGGEEPWYLATNLLDCALALKCYQRRMWHEEFHGYIKKHGFDLESTMLQDFLKLSRLTLAVAILMFGWSRLAETLFIEACVTSLIAMIVVT